MKYWKKRKKIEKIFVKLLQTQEIIQISVTDICKITHLNRSTFYANYIDIYIYIYIYDFADKVKEKLELEVQTLFKEEIVNKRNSNDYLKLFYRIKDNKLFYDLNILIKPYKFF